MWREVNRPLLLRPPLRFLTSRSDFSGLLFVISSKDGSALKRDAGVRGLNVLSAIKLCQVDFLASLKGDDRLFPVRGAGVGCGALALFLAVVVRGVHGDHGLAEELLDGSLDLRFVGARAHAEDVLVQLFAEQCGLLGEADCFDDVKMFVHYLEILSASCDSASLVTMILRNASNCSVFTSEAVTSWVGRTL